MKIILASGNKGKIKEIQNYYKSSEVLPYMTFIDKFDIVENGTTYKQNALIKAQAVYKRLKDLLREDFVVLSDDSGITVPALGNIPGIYSARFAREGASDKENLFKLIEELKKRSIKKTPAYYTAAMAMVSQKGEFTVHGWMHGSVIDEAKGERGFGYDPMFVPENFDKTLGELDDDIKKEISHRTGALRLARYLLDFV